MKLKTTPRCPECHKVSGCPDQSSFFVEDGVTHCGLCGWHLDTEEFAEVEVPSFLERLLKSLVLRNMLSIDRVDANSFVASNEEALSNAVTVNFQHRQLMISGVITWFEVKESSDFKPHNTDLAAIEKYVPLVSAMVTEFLADGFLISEAPGKEGRGLCNAAISFLTYGTITEGLGGGKVAKTIYVRGHLRWDMSYRRTGQGVEKIPS